MGLYIILAIFITTSLVFLFSTIESYDPLDPFSNITIKWDIMSWNSYGYMAMVTMYNYQQYRHIDAPGWQLGWTWAKKEVIWDMWGCQATKQGDCSQFKDNIPHCCEKSPTIVDLLPSASYNHRTSNCCKGGVLGFWARDPANAIASFQLSVGQTGTTNKTIKVPKNFTLKAPGLGYTCGPGKVTQPSQFPTPDGRRTTQAMVSWSITCKYSQFLARGIPSCCVSLSAFYNKDIVGCPTCSCGCPKDNPKNCTTNSDSTMICTNHMCPVRVHWHIKTSYKDYWKVRVTVTNFKYNVNFSDWTLVIQHPSLNHITRVLNFQYKPLTLEPINDTGIFYGSKYKNDVLIEGGEHGSVQSEILMEKVNGLFTFKNGWGFPRTVYFNGDQCVQPPPDEYPGLPNTAVKPVISSFIFVIFLVVLV